MTKSSWLGTNDRLANCANAIKVSEMKRLVRISGLVLIGVIICTFAAFTGYRIYQHHQSGKVAASVREGDLIFQTCKSAVGIVIRDATNSRFDHLGIVTKRDGQWFVYEAIEPVVFTPLREWVERGVLSQGDSHAAEGRESLASPEIMQPLKPRWREMPASITTIFSVGPTTACTARNWSGRCFTPRLESTFARRGGSAISISEQNL